MADDPIPPVSIPSAPAPSSVTTSVQPVSTQPSGTTTIKGTTGKDEDGFSSYPPFAEGKHVNSPPSLSATMLCGQRINRLKIDLPKNKPWKRPLRQAPPRNVKITGRETDNLTRYALIKHERCVRRYTRVMSERLEEISRPPVRTIMNLWRERKDTLAPEVIHRFRCMLNATCLPLRTDDAYTLFKCIQQSQKKQKKVQKKLQKTKPKRDIYEWQCHHGSHVKKSKPASAPAGNAIQRWRMNVSVRLARALQKKLNPLSEVPLLNPKSVHLSNIVFANLRRLNEFHITNKDITNNSPKTRFLIMVSNKITLWINEIIEASEDKMLLMDADEDEDVDSMLPPDEPMTSESSRTASPGPPDEKPLEDDSEKGQPASNIVEDSVVLPNASEPSATSAVSPKSSEPGATSMVSPKSSAPGEISTISPKSSAPSQTTAISPKSSAPGEITEISPKTSAPGETTAISPKTSAPGQTSPVSPKPSVPIESSALKQKSSPPSLKSPGPDVALPDTSKPSEGSALIPKPSQPGEVTKVSMPSQTSDQN